MTNSEVYGKLGKGLSEKVSCQLILTLDGTYIITGGMKTMEYYDSLFDAIKSSGADVSNCIIIEGPAEVSGNILLYKNCKGGFFHGME